MTTTRNGLSTTRNDLSTTRDQLSTTRDQLSTTRNELSTTRDQLQQTIDRLNRFEEEQKVVIAHPTNQPSPQQHRTTLQPSPQQPTTTLRQPPPPQRQAETDNPITIMAELIQPYCIIISHTTQHIYATKIQHLFNSITIGKVYNINGNECFFKLHLPQTNRRLHISHCNDIRRYKPTIFINDVIALNEGSWCYYLRLSIEKYDKVNSQCFLVDITKSGSKLLEYGTGHGNYIDDWKRYRDDKGEVLFYFKKKS